MEDHLLKPINEQKIRQKGFSLQKVGMLVQERHRHRDHLTTY